MAVALSYCAVYPCDPGCSRVMAPPGIELSGVKGGTRSGDDSSSDDDEYNDEEEDKSNVPMMRLLSTCFLLLIVPTLLLFFFLLFNKIFSKFKNEYDNCIKFFNNNSLHFFNNLLKPLIFFPDVMA